MKVFFLKLTAYFILLFGVALGLAALLGAVALFITNPKANTTKVALVAISLIVFTVIIGLVSFSFFELFTNNAEELEKDTKNNPREWRRAQDGSEPGTSNNS